MSKKLHHSIKSVSSDQHKTTQITQAPLNLPTLQEINDDHSAARASLLMFRVLCSSDLTFHYALFKRETLIDLLDVSNDLVLNDRDSLTPQELEEFYSYLSQIRCELLKL